MRRRRLLSVPSLQCRAPWATPQFADVAPWANRGQTANFQQTAPEIHVSPRFASVAVGLRFSGGEPGHLPRANRTDRAAGLCAVPPARRIGAVLAANL